MTPLAPPSFRSFLPSSAAGLARLGEFATQAGQSYNASRNFDLGPSVAPTVSLLSPYIRRRLILEEEAVRVAISAHEERAETFVREVFWRTYWKGWMEQRPSVWRAYRSAAATEHERMRTDDVLRTAWEAACTGRTGLTCFDAWARELMETNWLHNHARMWFASIWIFTLRLPWSLGAEFFLRHLLDGDPASNTLSWRWVAGLHTPGKHYVARAENIARFSGGRFNPVGELNENPEPLTELAQESTPVRLASISAPPSGPVALLIHDDDLCPESLDLGQAKVMEVGGFSTVDEAGPAESAPGVTAFARGALTDALERAGAQFGCPTRLLSATEMPGWVRGVRLPMVAAVAPVGPSADALAELPIHYVRRLWDTLAWPYATRGFSQLRQRIPAILARLERETSHL